VPDKKQRPRPSTAGAKDDEEQRRIARDQAREVRDLARRDDWRESIEAMELSEREARALRVAVIRARWWGGGTRRP
jgi:hypothetical protein